MFVCILICIIHNNMLPIKSHIMSIIALIIIYSLVAVFSLQWTLNADTLSILLRPDIKIITLFLEPSSNYKIDVNTRRERGNHAPGRIIWIYNLINITNHIINFWQFLSSLRKFYVWEFYSCAISRLSNMLQYICDGLTRV